uniref:Uncharacterized protein n=1 Tax=Steinernema glaseri TaxID=37863 RepID=A0A1I7YUP1_9BILA
MTSKFACSIDLAVSANFRVLLSLHRHMGATNQRSSNPWRSLHFSAPSLTPGRVDREPYLTIYLTTSKRKSATPEVHGPPGSDAAAMRIAH